MALSHGLVLGLILLILGGVGYFLLAASLNREATNEVQTAAQSEIDRVRESGQILPPADKDVPSSSAIRLAVILPGGRVVAEVSEVPSWLRPQREPVTTIRAHGEDVRIVTIVLRKGPQWIGTIVAGKSLEPEHALLSRVRLLLTGGGLVGVVASMMAGWFLSGRASRPVRRAYEAQAAFASDASHELRTPLAFVRSGVEVLSPHEPQLGAEILREVGYLTSIADRLLDLARIQNGNPVLPLQRVALEPLCREAAARSRRALGIRLELRIPPGLEGMADPVGFEAALDAVLENVARHGGSEATIEAAARDGRVVVSVVDHGPGLSPELRQRAFERFVRADPARTRASGGAGLGLPLARSLIEAQRGRVWLDQTPGGGVTARIEIRGAVGGAIPGNPAPAQTEADPPDSSA
jgi:signal transduction histidine kinase